MKLGAQLYTVRDYCQNIEDFYNTLKKIADIGYKTVQVSGTCEYDAEQLKKELDKLGLECVITHYPIEKTIASVNDTMQVHKILACQNIGIGYYDIENKGFDDFCNTFMPIAKSLEKNNFNLCYHNHHHEFNKIDGKTILQKMAEAFSENQLKFTLDTYWVQRAGGDPVAWIKALKNRVPCIHLKDMKFNSDMAVIGEGNMNWSAILEACESSNTQYLLVEQDSCYDEDPFDCLRRSYNYLHSLGFE